MLEGGGLGFDPPPPKNQKNWRGGLRFDPVWLIFFVAPPRCVSALLFAPGHACHGRIGSCILSGACILTNRWQISPVGSAWPISFVAASSIAGVVSIFLLRPPRRRPRAKTFKAGRGVYVSGKPPLTAHNSNWYHRVQSPGSVLTPPGAWQGYCK